jgi:4-amino-4-deoxy-L-arabinose transferase-like glycosyltransferase
MLSHLNNSRYRAASSAIAIIIAVTAQSSLSIAKNIPLAILLFALAIMLMLTAQSDTTPTISQPSTQSAIRIDVTWRLLFLVASAVCTLLAFTLNTDTSFAVEGIPEYQFTFPGVAAWFASIACFLAAFWHPEKNFAEWRNALAVRTERLRGGLTFHLTWTHVALIAVLAIGIVSYFYRLDATPAEMTSDHAEKLLDVNDVVDGHFPVFFIRNTGREPLEFYLARSFMVLFGFSLSHILLKTVTAFIGFLTIPATFLLAREMFDDTVGVFAAFFVATLHWAMAIARMGLRYPFTPFFTALSFYFFWRALKYQKRNDYLMTGLMMGAGLYGYIPSRDAPFVVLGLGALWLIFEGWRRIDDGWSFALNLSLMLALMFVVFAPLLRYSLDFPEMFWYRALTRVTSTEHAVQGNIVTILGQNLANLALAFNWRGDEVWPTNISYDPTFDLVTGALFILGIAMAIWRFVRRRAPIYFYLLAVFAALILPSALSLAFPRENPSLVRMGGAIPFAAIIVALPVAFLFRALRQSFERWRAGAALSVLGIGMVLAPIIALNYHWYFVDYDLSYRKSAQNSSEVAAVIRDFAGSVGDLQHAYFIGYPYWIDGRAIAINIGDIHWKNFTLDAKDFMFDANTNMLFIVNPEDKANLKILQGHYPQGQIKTFHSRTPGKDFLEFFVPANTNR